MDLKVLIQVPLIMFVLWKQETIQNFGLILNTGSIK